MKSVLLALKLGALIAILFVCYAIAAGVLRMPAAAENPGRHRRSSRRVCASDAGVVVPDFALALVGLETDLDDSFHVLRRGDVHAAD